jgi:hypothetical protein
MRTEHFEHTVLKMFRGLSVVYVCSPLDSWCKQQHLCTHTNSAFPLALFLTVTKISVMSIRTVLQRRRQHLKQNVLLLPIKTAMFVK